MKRLVVLFVMGCVLFSSVSLFAQTGLPPQASQGVTAMPSPDAAGSVIPFVDLSIRQPQSNQEVAFSIQLMLLITVITLAPSILILATCFLRLSIVLDFIKRALSLQQVPPTAVLNGIAFFLTIFIMWPTFTAMYENAFRPMADGQINIETAYREAEAPMRLFMFNQMYNDTSYIDLFMQMGNRPQPNTIADVPTHILVPAYILHELTVAFKIGILLYIPFIVIDMVVASILMSMGMIMLPPVQISMPFKLILFILIDGWGLLTQQLFNSIIR
jgi:flagellar biosynthetic protein FliP